MFNPDFGSQIFQAFTVGSNPLSASANPGAALSFDIFPSPTNGPLNIEISLPVAEDAKLEIFNSMGQKVLSKEYKKFSHEYLEFDFSKFESGIYYAKIVSNHYSETKEIIVTK